MAKNVPATIVACVGRKGLKRIGIDDKDFRSIRNPYYEQKAAIKLTEGITEWTDIKRGVRQGCVMSQDLLNLYSEFILKDLKVVE